MFSDLPWLRYFPKNHTDWGAFAVLVFSIHSVLIYEFFVVLPYYRDLHPDLLFYTHIVFGLFMYANTVTNAYKVMTTDSSTKGIMMPVFLKPGWRFCPSCECNSPPRSFHCFTCKRCLLKRDHHCSFTGNCIGFRNHRYYFMLLFYMWSAAVYANVMNVDYVYHMFGGFSVKTLFIIIAPMMAWIFGYMDSVSVIGAAMTTLCLAGLLITTALLAYHSMSVINGQIVYERTHKIRDYDIGLKGNIITAFGTKWYLAWLCPFISSPLPGNGVEFPKRGSYENSKDI